MGSISCWYHINRLLPEAKSLFSTERNSHLGTALRKSLDVFSMVILQTMSYYYRLFVSYRFYSIIITIIINIFIVFFVP
jgi:ABC-type transport system involved in cytochrome bd biosynthesis fused ATPase/permease subunit